MLDTGIGGQGLNKHPDTESSPTVGKAAPLFWPPPPGKTPEHLQSTSAPRTGAPALACHPNTNPNSRAGGVTAPVLA